MGSAVSGVLALALWATGCVYLRALTGALGGRRAPWATLALCGALLALDPLARAFTGPVAGVLDVVSPGRALGRAALGALDLRDLLAVAAPGLIAAVGLRGLAATANSNDRLRLALVPITLALGLAVLRPIPLLVDLSDGDRFSLGADRGIVVSSLDTLILLTVREGPGLDREHRDAARALRDLLGALERASTSVFSTNWLKTETPGLQIELRASDTARSVSLASPDRVGWELAVLVSTVRDSPSPVVPWIGAAPSDLARQSLRGAELSVLPEVTGPLLAPAVVVRASAPLTGEARFALDQHVMGGGGLLMLVGKGDGSETPGAKLIGPWGLGIGHPIGQETGAELTDHLAVRGLTPPTAPAATQELHETEGLTERLVLAAGVPVALALSGSVPSGVASEPEWSARSPRTMSDGAVRVIAISDALVERNPALLGRSLDWVLGRDERAAMLSPVLKSPGWPQRSGSVLLAVVLGGFLALGLARRAGEGP